jgi:hypothetical protein
MNDEGFVGDENEELVVSGGNQHAGDAGDFRIRIGSWASHIVSSSMVNLSHGMSAAFPPSPLSFFSRPTTVIDYRCDSEKKNP